MAENLSTRISISLSEKDRNSLKAIAHEKHVSLGWVVREAIRRYIKVEAPQTQELWEQPVEEHYG